MMGSHSLEAPLDTNTAASAALSPSHAPKKARRSQETVVFVSREPETVRFDIAGVRGLWDSGRSRLVWRVPPDRLEAFRKHYHVTSNRVVEMRPPQEKKP